MKRILFLLIAVALLGAGCGGSAESRPVMSGGPDMPTPTALPVAVRTMVAENTATPDVMRVPAGTAAPVETAGAVSTGEPAALLDPQPTALPLMPPPPSEPFQDCARTPGLEGCDPQAPALTGVLAFENKVVDLANGRGWQVRSPSAWLDWSPDGSQVLMELGGEGGSAYVLYEREGEPVGELPFADRPHWGMDNRALPYDTVSSPEGREARLEYTEDTRWLLHVRPSPLHEWQTLEIEPEPTDQLYSLVSWIPATDLILAQRYFAGNAAMMFGGELVTLDADSGQKTSLDSSAPLGEDAVFAWLLAPNGAALAPELAFVSTGGEQRRLALIDFNSGGLRYPLPDGVTVNDMAWRPDGQRLAFSVIESGPLAPPEAAQVFSGPGIYLLDPETGEVEGITQAPTGGVDGFPNWSADGELLLYARTADLQTVEVFARRLADGQEWKLVTGVPFPEGVGGTVIWQRVLDAAH